MPALLVALATSLPASPMGATPLTSQEPGVAPALHTDGSTTTNSPTPVSPVTGDGAGVDEPSYPAWLSGVGARLQLRHTWEDPGDVQTTALRRGRIWVRGLAADRFSYVVQTELAGSGVRLLDAQVSTDLVGPVQLRLGQGKVPFGRQQLNSSGALSLVDRSAVDGRFTPARRAGVQLYGSALQDRVEFALGRFEARGIGGDPGVPGRSMTAGRVVWTPLGSYPTVESPLQIPEGPRLALGAAGLSTVEERGEHRARVTRWAGEAALRTGGVQVVAEAFREEASSAAGHGAPMEEGGGRLEQAGAWGGYLQAGLLSRDLTHEVVARHARIRPDGSSDAILAEDIFEGEVGLSETGVGYTRYLDGHRTKVQGDIHRIRRGTEQPRETRIRLQLTLTLW